MQEAVSSSRVPHSLEPHAPPREAVALLSSIAVHQWKSHLRLWREVCLPVFSLSPPIAPLPLSSAAPAVSGEGYVLENWARSAKQIGMINNAFALLCDQVWRFSSDLQECK